jgi:hypothetical protein
MRLLIALLLLFVMTPALSQKQEWIKKSPSEWPSIAMINEVWYKNGDQYVHSSFQYAATGFLIDIGTDTIAATAKHALWVAKNKNSKYVSINRDLKKWMMHPKGNAHDTVLIKELLNTDTTEVLEGKNSTVTQRDWILFSTTYRSPSIQPLKPRYTKVKVGEMGWYVGCPYDDARCAPHEIRIVAIEGNRIIFSRPDSINLGGASGSPLIDSNGFLIGILGGSSIDPTNGKSALYAISTNYLKKALRGSKSLNAPLITLQEAIGPVIQEKGIEQGIKKLQKTFASAANYEKYDLSAEGLNTLGRSLEDKGRLSDAIEVYKFCSQQFRWFATTWNHLARVYLASQQKVEATKAYEQVIKLWPENTEALEGLAKLRGTEKNK